MKLPKCRPGGYKRSEVRPTLTATDQFGGSEIKPKNLREKKRNQLNHHILKNKAKFRFLRVTQTSALCGKYWKSGELQADDARGHLRGTQGQCNSDTAQLLRPGIVLANCLIRKKREKTRPASFLGQRSPQADTCSEVQL